MIFVDAENKLKYDTDRMELVSDKVKMEVGRPFRISVNAEIYRSKKRQMVGRGEMDGWRQRSQGTRRKRGATIFTKV